MRTLLIVAAIAFVPPDARADLAGGPRSAAPRDAFRAWVARWAAAHDAYLSDWWSAELDDDDSPEQIALVCRRETKYQTGDGAYLIERGSTGTRFAIGFEVDGRTPLCSAGPPPIPPPFRATKNRTIDHLQGFHHGSEESEIALRGGVPVLVRHRYDAFDVQPRRHEREEYDWDRLCARGRRARLPSGSRGTRVHDEPLAHPADDKCYADLSTAQASELTLLEP
jgi:hypothetical protein